MLSRVRRVARVAVVGAVALVAVPGALAATSDTERTLELASSLVEEGRLIEAKDRLLELRRGSASAEERTRVLEMLSLVDARITGLSEAEVSTQKAEYALETGDIRRAEMHATRVKRMDGVSPELRIRAVEALNQAALLKEELAPMIAPTLERAVRDFTDGRYAEAKASLAAISRSGVRLSREQASAVRQYQRLIVAEERERGEPFETEQLSLGVVGPAAGAGASAVASGAAAQQAEDEPEAPASDEPEPGDDLFEQAARADAQRMMAEADEAFEAGRLEDARRLYRRLTTVHARHLNADEMAMATERLEEARVRLGAAAGNLIDTEIRQRDINRQQVIAEVDNLEAQAREALGEGDTDRARQLVADARLRWNTANANGLLAETQFSGRDGELRALLDQIDQRARALDEAEKERIARELQTEQEAARRAAADEKETRIRENFERLKDLQREQRYEEALQVVEEILFLEPTNAAGNLMRDILTDIMIYREYDRIQRDKGLAYGREIVEMQEGMVFPQAPISFPPDWPEISLRRGQIVSFVESPQDREALATLEARRIPASFSNNSLEDIIQFIATVTNLNFDVDWDSLEQIGIDRDDTVSLELREVPARVVLERVLEKVSLDDFNRAGFSVQDGIIVVASDDDLRRNTFIVIYDVRDLLFEVSDYTNVPELDLETALNQSQQGGGGGGGQSIFEDDDQDDDLFPDPEEQLEQVLEIIQTTVDFDGWQDNGGDTGVVQTLNGNLIITNTSRNHRDIQALLDKLREVRQLQITVETRILQVGADFFERIGFDFDVYLNGDDSLQAANNQVESFGLGGLAGEGTTIRPSDLVNPDRTGVGTGYFVSDFDEDTGAITYEFGDVPFAVPAQSGWSTIPIQQNSNNITEDLIGSLSDFAATVGLLNPALSVAGTFLDDIQVDFLIEATQADQRSVTLNAPRLTFTNGKAANIFVANQRSYVSNLQPVVGNSSVAFDPQISVLNTGFSLALRGVVSADRRYVTIDTVVSVAELVTFRPVEVSAAVGGAGGSIGGGTFSDTFSTPEVVVTRIQTGVTVPDQGTVLLGGQRLTSEFDVETGVPVLSKIPLINRFFTNTSTAKEESSLLILMKPKILIQNEQEEDAFPGLQDTLEDPFAF